MINPGFVGRLPATGRRDPSALDPALQLRLMLLQQQQVKQILTLPPSALPRYFTSGGQLGPTTIFAAQPTPAEPMVRPGSLLDYLRGMLEGETDTINPGLPGMMVGEIALKKLAAQLLVFPLKIVGRFVDMENVGNPRGAELGPQIPGTTGRELRYLPPGRDRVARFSDEGLARVAAQILLRKQISGQGYNFDQTRFLQELLTEIGRRTDGGRELESNESRRERLTRSALQVLIAFQNGYLGAAGGGALLRGDKADP